MKLHHQHTNIERGGIKAESTFTIKTTAKSFEILSSGLYTDPITAVIRELSCNAYDAHVAAGKTDVPFTIHLPNTLEPFFSVTDYGIGLSDDQVQGELIPKMIKTATTETQAVDENGDFMFSRSGGLYTTYFDSTKTDSNDYIGALGLGSKSPFSYVDAFDVTSCYNGTKNIYSIFLNEDGIPSVALMGTTDTLESNGLQVSIAVESDDFHKFKEKTASILRYFPIPPEVTNSIPFEFVPFPKKRLKGDGWFVATRNWKFEPFTAVQGNVPYRVNVEQLTTDLSSEEINFLHNCTVVVFFNIGDLDVAANREEIRYDKQTKKALVDKMRQIHEDLTTEIEKKAIKHQNSFWNACIALDCASKDIFGDAQSIRNFVRKGATNNETLKRYVNNSSLTFTSLRQHGLVKYTETRTRTTHQQRTRRVNIRKEITPSSKTVILYNDVKTGGIGRVKKFLFDSNEYTNAIVISKFKEPIPEYSLAQVDPTTNNTATVPVFDHSKEFQDLLVDIGNPDVMLVSDTPAPVRQQRNHSVPMFPCSEIAEEYNNRYVNYVKWHKCDISDVNLTDGGLYFLLKFNNRIMSGEQHIQWDINNVKYNFDHMLTAINTTHGTSFVLDDIYGSSVSAYKQLKKNDKWFNIFDLFKSSISTYEDGIKYATDLAYSNDSYSVMNHAADNRFVGCVGKLDADSTFRKVVEPVLIKQRKYQVNHEISEFIVDFTRVYDIQSPYKAKPFFTNNDFDSYPMLKAVGSLHNYQQDWDILFDYITLIDRN